MMDLAVLLREITVRGDAERQFCREVLEMVLRYSDNKSAVNFFNY